jgi:hypothetical protein
MLQPTVAKPAGKCPERTLQSMSWNESGRKTMMYDKIRNHEANSVMVMMTVSLHKQTPSQATMSSQLLL